ncbi:MAG: cytochrome C biosynthesis protein [Zymomonas mobilis subsp. pomaceae]|uniref:Cytochrome c biogenesis factor-like protein n=1 Tax=Zymomonas mobilis subsp. pomaceae (strain ATCC 29192 / DSM 22645 / JCM 10191 / CCUG 17912 / NBRC 13757 / NCIMB 11200 / NRRL B-4491 / Barker I) TaxID=579138 RepID=F8ET79_ZYMMT|nr:hypothetical protein [Zymomonas mobilis]AEI36969.1 hypothetical protein Zymop_0065 [Zymomonas mobilis subsp. pomaceae ATCC 29192]MDX5948342.1 cytochrome C biosynthesis protein [Zymomonas mobilis subsp. pomaceae]GEB89098.1 hypothetical protein ZMO02_07350 [Zymomonas mobilis subsp. pomaceae]
MNGWIIAALLSALVFLSLWKIGRLPLIALQAVAAVLCFGLAGYAWQGQPFLKGHPAENIPKNNQQNDPFIQDRWMLFPHYGEDSRALITSDAFIKQGQYAYAVGWLKSEIRRRPKSAMLWTALGDALVQASDGRVVPAAKLSFEQAEKLAPKSAAGPAYFYAVALLGEGHLDQTLVIWHHLLDEAPEKALWRHNIEERMAILERLKNSLSDESH